MIPSIILFCMFAHLTQHAEQEHQKVARIPGDKGFIIFLPFLNGVIYMKNQNSYMS